jgi:hypothetical protein
MIYSEITGVTIHESKQFEVLDLIVNQAIEKIVVAKHNKAEAQISIQIDNNTSIDGVIKYELQYIDGDAPEDKPEANNSFTPELIGYHWGSEVESLIIEFNLSATDLSDLDSLIIDQLQHHYK